MPMFARRKVLQFMGLGAATPAIKTVATANEEVMKLTKTNVAAHGDDVDLPDYGRNWDKRRDKAINYLNLMGKLPDHVEQEIRRSSKYVRELDHDIAIKCWSYSVKVQEQRKRNYEREIEQLRNTDMVSQAQKAFEKVTGFKWPI